MNLKLDLQWVILNNKKTHFKRIKREKFVTFVQKQSDCHKGWILYSRCESSCHNELHSSCNTSGENNNLSF